MLMYNLLEVMCNLLDIMYNLHEDGDINVEVVHNLIKVVHIPHKP